MAEIVAPGVNEPEPVDLDSATGVERPLVMKFGGSLVEQLGAQLYPSVTATVAELISNAWDADAENVWISIPFSKNWDDPRSAIVVLDDGHGMTRSEAQHMYLVVGRKKRLSKFGDRSERGRPVHGRKGIGKLAAFGTAGYLECTTVRDGRTTAFGLDYDELRRLNPDQNYYVDNIKDPEALETPNGDILDHGTRVRLSSLRVKRKISEESFHTSMSRRFALRGMNVFINGKPLRRFEIPLEYRLPRDQVPPGVTVDSEGWAVEELSSGDVVKWWVGFTKKPLDDNEQQGISVLARDKMAQRPFKFDRSQGTTGQLGYEYLVGEVKADWLDEGDDIDTDFIQSNRDQLQVENPRLDEFMAWGRGLLVWALRIWQELRQEDLAAATEGDLQIKELLASVPPKERIALIGVARQIARIPAIDQPGVAELMKVVVGSRESSRLQVLVQGIEDGDVVDEAWWSNVDRAMEIDAGRVEGILEARVTTLEKLRVSLPSIDVASGLRKRIADDPWILDPRWSLFAEAVEVGNSADPEDKFDGLLVLRPAAPAPADAILMVQVVDERAAAESGIKVLRRRMRAVAEKYPESTVEALFLAPEIESRVEQVGRGRLRLSSWNSALADSIARHRAWLHLAKRRGERATR